MPLKLASKWLRREGRKAKGLKDAKRSNKQRLMQDAPKKQERRKQAERKKGESPKRAGGEQSRGGR